jgi:predicted metalloendopeptidase
MSGIVSGSNSRTLANYIGWRLAKTKMRYLHAEARAIRQEYKKAIEGQNQEEPRWKICVKEVGFNGYSNQNLRIPAAAMYVKKHFSAEAKEEMVNMIGYIKGAFAKMLNDLPWMDDQTKERARTKMSKMSQVKKSSFAFTNFFIIIIQH